MTELQRDSDIKPTDIVYYLPKLAWLVFAFAIVTFCLNLWELHSASKSIHIDVWNFKNIHAVTLAALTNLGYAGFLFSIHKIIGETLHGKA